MTVGGANLRLTSLGVDAVSVAAIRGREGLSRPYRFDIDVRTDVDLLALDPTLLGSAATLFWSGEDLSPIVTQGILSALTARGIDRQHKRFYTLRLAPRLALLRRRKNSRIFQNSPVVDIITQVLDGHAIPKIWNLTKKYPVREYCVQYQETDYEFLTRLCAEAGIFYYFLQPNVDDLSRADSPDKLTEHIVFGDDIRHYPPLLDPANMGTALRIPFAQARGGGAIGGGDYINEFDYRRAIRSQSVTLRDYDFTRPMLDLQASLHENDDAKAAPPKAFGESLAQTFGPLEVYEHQAEYGETDVSRAHADMLLEGQRARAIVAKGAGICRRFTPGYRFGLEQHPVEGLDGREYTIVSVQHVYSFKDDIEAYTNTFECIPASTVYRPKRKPRSLAQVLETAKVVGPVGETVYTDSLGRIKVQFFWDRDGGNNEHSSCFIRVAQPWAGTSWGVQFIPRIGDEVLVSFLGGDEDRPMVLGSVYNATHPPPFPLPAAKSKSGIRTQSIGGPGSNELSFEDMAGAESVLLRSERTLREVAGADHRVDVAGEQTTTVGASQHIAISGGRSLRVDGDETRSIGGALLENVQADHRVSISGGRVQNVAGNDSLTSRGANIHHRGNYSLTVDGAAVTTVGTDEEPSISTLKVNGRAFFDATEKIKMHSDTRICLEAGESSITLTEDTVRIDAKKIILRAKEQLVLMGDGPAIELSQEVEVLADKIRMFSAGGSVELDAEAAHVDGPLVKLNCGAGQKPEISDEVDEAKTRVFRWRCLDENLRPYKNKTYRLTTEGFRTRGTTTEDGIIECDIPIDAVSAQIVLWKGKFPQGDRMTLTIRLGALPPATEVFGALLRLRHLGYYAGPDSDEMTADLAEALAEFQADHGLATSGEVNAETADKLEEVHP
jgi:type VI secretion system secreted protein VgrG